MDGTMLKGQIAEVARVPVDGGTRQTLARNAISPTVTRAGDRLAYVSLEPRGQALVVADVDGGNPHTIIRAGEFEGLMAPSFSPDGKQLAFAAIAPSPFTSAPAPSASVPGQSPVPGRPSIGAPPKTSPGDVLAWLRSAGGLLPRAVAAHGVPMDIFVVATDGSARRRVTELSEDRPSPSWSPDGKRLAFLAEAAVYVVPADGSDFAVAIFDRGGFGRIDWRA
jgi:Tol biopolymer transport system component